MLDLPGLGFQELALHSLGGAALRAGSKAGREPLSPSFATMKLPGQAGENKSSSF